MAGTERIRIESISVGDRLREDQGDLAALERSIGQYGLLHPIVVDDAGTLICGGRRLEAARRLGWKEIEVRRYRTLTASERLEIELEENLQRKDLTAYERSRTLVALAKTAAVGDQEEPNCTDSVQLPPHQRTGSLRRVADRIGVPVATINAAQQHVAAVEAHPALADAPQSVAIDYARAVQERPHLAGAPVGEVVELRRAERALETPGGESEADKQARYMATLERVMGPDPERERRELLARLAAFIRDAAKLQSLAPDTFLHAMGDGERAVVRSHIVGTRRWCDRWELALDEAERSGLRVVGGVP